MSSRGRVAVLLLGIFSVLPSPLQAQQPCGQMLPGGDAVAGSRYYLRYRKSLGQDLHNEIWERDGGFPQDDEGRFEFGQEDDSISFLKITNVKATDAGHYRVKCAFFVYETFSNAVTLHVVEREPGVPQFQNLQNFENCQDCLLATEGQRLAVTCETTGGSTPLQVNLFKNGVPMRVAMDYEYRSRSNDLTVTATYLQLAAEAADDMANYTCSVWNNVRRQPLESRARLYLAKTPSLPVLTNLTVREDIATDLRCSTSGGRPKPDNISFVFEGKVLTFHVTSVPLGSMGNSTSTFSTFDDKLDRRHNNKDIRCCVYHVTGSFCSTPSKVNVTFPPLRVSLREVQHTNILPGKAKVALNCTVSESNPASDIDWTGLKGIKRAKERFSYARMYGVETQELLSLTVNQSRNGKEVTCMSRNPSFPNLNIYGSYVINVTYPPNVTIHGGPTLSAYQDDAVELSCLVDSNPVSIITWIHDSKNIKVASRSSVKVRLESVNFSHAGVYFCSANNGVGPVGVSNITLVVLDRSSKPNQQSEEGTGTATTSAVAAVVAIVAIAAVVVIVTILFLRSRRRKKTTFAPRPYDEDMSGQAGPELPDSAPTNNTNGLNHHDEPVEYAQAIPKSQRGVRQEPQGNGEILANDGTSGMIYAELDLDTADGNERSKPNSNHAPTDYVTIDFTKKATKDSTDHGEK